MPKLKSCWMAAAALLLLACAAQAQPRADAAAQASVTGAKVLAVGVFSSMVATRQYTPSVADNIRDSARAFVLLRRGTVVEAGLDTGIGLRYQIQGQPKGARVPVDVVVRHPAIVNPDTQLPMTVSTARYERVIGEVEHSVWSFDMPGDLVPGVYVIEILHRGRSLARQEFRVTVQEE